MNKRELLKHMAAFVEMSAPKTPELEQQYKWKLRDLEHSLTCLSVEDSSEEKNLSTRIKFGGPEELGRVIACNGWSGESQIKCPVCGDPFNHVQAAYTRVGSDSIEAILEYPGTEVKGTTNYR